MTYYYPNNLAEKYLFANLWTSKDLIVIFSIFVAAILNVIVFKGGIWLFVALVAYTLFSAKIASGYSLTKLGVLYIKYLITDVLVYYWR